MSATLFPASPARPQAVLPSGFRPVMLELDSSGEANAAATDALVAPPADSFAGDVPRESLLQRLWSAWSIVMVCVGVALIAACLLIPQADDNRRLFWETEKLRGDLDYLEKQAAVNEEFLRRVSDDPAIVERLAQRQFRMVRRGSGVVDIGERADAESRSPLALLTIPSPPPMPAITQPGGRLAEVCRHPRNRLYVMCAAAVLVAIGLVLDSSPAVPKIEPNAQGTGH